VEKNKKSAMNTLINIIFSSCFFCSVLLQNNTNEKVLSAFIIINEEFQHILDVSIEEFNECKDIKKGYHFTISINDAEHQEYSGMKSLYISRSYYKDFISNGYGYFYYKDYLFILQGEQLNDIFKKANKTKTFLYKDEPITIFDPSRWLYYYWNKEFYLADSSPCGG
jgi:hypothetical protein